MFLLGAKLYDPAAAVTKATSAVLAMTALDTTNLRIAFTIPAHGMVRVRLAGTLHGATTMPQILLGVMNGAAVVGKISPMYGGTNIAATSLVKCEADFCLSGLTPGAVSWDAAYGVETLVAATGLKYGGPNNTTANDAFGGFVFEVWDPAPASIGSVTGSVGSVTGFTPSDVTAIKANTDKLGASFVSAGTLGAGTTTSFTLPAGQRAGVIAGQSCIQVTSGAAIGETQVIASYTAATGVGAPANAFTNAPGTATYVVFNAPASVALTASDFGSSALSGIAGAVWDEAIAGHLTGGSTGAALNGAGAAGDPWTTTLPGAYGTGTAGKIIGNIADSVFGYKP